MCQDACPSGGSPAQFPGAVQRDGGDAVDDRRSGIGVTEQGEGGNGDGDGDADAADVVRVVGDVAVDEEVAEHVRASLVQGAVVAGGRARGSGGGQAVMDGAGFHVRNERGHPRHPVAGRFDTHAPLRECGPVGLGEGVGPGGVDHAAHGTPERTDRRRLCPVHDLIQDTLTHRGVEGVEFVDEELDAPDSGGGVVELVQHARKPGTQRAGMVRETPGRVLAHP